MDKKNTKKRRTNEKFPACNKHMDCFANKNSRCICLNDNDFGKKDCPFYKTESEVRNG